MIQSFLTECYRPEEQRVGKSFRQARLHYAWIVAGVTFLVLLVTAGIRATPGVLMVPLEAEFGWTSAAISTAIAINLALFGLIGPFAASLMDRWGLRRLVLCALLLLAASVGLTTVMKSQWQLVLLWGVCVGSGTGVTALVLAAVVANRWFDKHRGLVLGGLTAAKRHWTTPFSASPSPVAGALRLAECLAGRCWLSRGRFHLCVRAHAGSPFRNGP